MVDVSQPEARGGDECDADKDEDDGHGAFVEQRLKRVQQNQRQAESRKRDEVLHSRPHVALGHRVIHVHRLVVVDGHLEHAEVDKTGDEEEPRKAGQQRDLSHHDGRYHQQERDNLPAGVDGIFGLQQSVNALLAAHQPVYVVALIAHDGAQEEDAEKDEVVHHEEAFHPSLIGVGKGDKHAEHDDHASG